MVGGPGRGVPLRLDYRSAGLSASGLTGRRHLPPPRPRRLARRGGLLRYAAHEGARTHPQRQSRASNRNRLQPSRVVGLSPANRQVPRGSHCRTGNRRGAVRSHRRLWLRTDRPVNSRRGCRRSRSRCGDSLSHSDSNLGPKGRVAGKAKSHHAATGPATRDYEAEKAPPQLEPCPAVQP